MYIYIFFFLIYLFIFFFVEINQGLSDKDINITNTTILPNENENENENLQSQDVLIQEYLRIRKQNTNIKETNIDNITEKINVKIDGIEDNDDTKNIKQEYNNGKEYLREFYLQIVQQRIVDNSTRSEQEQIIYPIYIGMLLECIRTSQLETMEQQKREYDILLQEQQRIDEYNALQNQNLSNLDSTSLLQQYVQDRIPILQSEENWNLLYNYIQTNSMYIIMRLLLEKIHLYIDKQYKKILMTSDARQRNAYMQEIMEKDFRQNYSLLSSYHDTPSSYIYSSINDTTDKQQQDSDTNYTIISSQLVNTVQVNWGLLQSDMLLRKRAAMLEVQRRGILNFDVYNIDIQLSLPAQYSLFCIEHTSSLNSPVEAPCKDVPQDTQVCKFQKKKVK